MNKRDFMTIRIPEEIKEQVREKARRERRSIADQVLVFVEAGLDAEKNQKSHAGQYDPSDK